MWEWRFFIEEENSGKFQLSEEYKDKLNKKPIEHRTDYYYDLSLPDFGLKERGSEHGSQFKPILELKVLLEEKKWGAELWKKIIKYPIDKSINPNLGLNTSDIIEILEYEKKDSSLVDQIEKIIKILNNEPSKRVKVKKSRLQIKDIYRFNHSRSIFKLERTKVNIFEENWESICIESPNARLLREFIRNQFLNIPEKIVAGYPKFISIQREK